MTREIWADFNARTADDCIWLTTVGSREAIAALDPPPQVGERVVLVDDGDGPGEEIKVTAVLERNAHGWLARPDWTTLVRP